MFDSIVRRLKRWYAGLTTYQLHRSCIICGKVSELPSLALCRECLRMLPWSGHYCQNCGKPLILATDTLCGRCATHSRIIDRLLFPCWYRPPIDELIKALKFKNQIVCARVLGAILTNYLVKLLDGHTLPQVIIPVPLHAQRLRQRGYNQAKELAAVVANSLHLPINNCYLVRTVNTVPQTLSPTRVRRHHLANAFTININNHHAGYQRVALIDDVFTTGATVNACVHVLLRSGVKHIQVWCVARASQ